MTCVIALTNLLRPWRCLRRCAAQDLKVCRHLHRTTWRNSSQGISVVAVLLKRWSVEPKFCGCFWEQLIPLRTTCIYSRTGRNKRPCFPVSLLALNTNQPLCFANWLAVKWNLVFYLHFFGYRWGYISWLFLCLWIACLEFARFSLLLWKLVGSALHCWCSAIIQWCAICRAYVFPCAGHVVCGPFQFETFFPEYGKVLISYLLVFLFSHFRTPHYLDIGPCR